MSNLTQFDLTKIMAALQTIKEYSSYVNNPLTPKRYYLDPVKNKKLGFVWYVRYLDNGIVIPSHWTTGTNDRGVAEKFAIENRERLLTAYYNRNLVKKPYCELYTILRKYYCENSPYLEIDRKRGRLLGDKARVTYHNFITKQFIPYLKKNGIKDFEQIDTPLLSRFQNYLLADKKTKDRIIHGIKPQTINHYISYISLIFDHLIQEGQTKTNPCKSLICLKIKNEEIRGCYEITSLKGVFNKTWKDQFSYLLCLLIYTTGMRNSEIERLKVNHLLVIDKVHFIDIQESKTKSGIRKVPLHDFVSRKLMAYIRKTGKRENDLIFNTGNRKVLGSRIYDKANFELAKFAKYSKEKLERENITFYSGRHFWKTLMDSEGLGEVEEYFMGHKVSADVAKRYNHKDKQGKKKLIERAKKVFQILNRYIFLSR